MADEKYADSDPKKHGWYLLTTEFDEMMDRRYEGWRKLDATTETVARERAESLFPPLGRYPTSEYGRGFPHNPRLVYFAGKVRTP